MVDSKETRAIQIQHICIANIDLLKSSSAFGDCWSDVEFEHIRYDELHDSLWEGTSEQDEPVAPCGSLLEDESGESEQKVSGESWAEGLILRLPTWKTWGDFLAGGLNGSGGSKRTTGKVFCNCLAV